MDSKNNVAKTMDIKLETVKQVLILSSLIDELGKNLIKAKPNPKLEIETRRFITDIRVEAIPTSVTEKNLDTTIQNKKPMPLIITELSRI